MLGQQTFGVCNKWKYGFFLQFDNYLYIKKNAANSRQNHLVYGKYRSVSKKVMGECQSFFIGESNGIKTGHHSAAWLHCFTATQLLVEITKHLLLLCHESTLYDIYDII